MKGDRYTVPLVYKLLEHYGELENGELPGSEKQTSYTDWGTVISRTRSWNAPHELVTILKADIDRSIRHLRMTSKFVVTNRIINGRDYGWCGFLLSIVSLDIIQIETAAIKRMVRFLNGEE